jgi:16S rRNA (cytidine1402-2'-O)-methyltransferase
VIFYETAKRIKTTLSAIAAIDPSATVSVSREITKLFEETVRGSPSDLAQKEYKGEIVLTVLFSPS